MFGSEDTLTIVIPAYKPTFLGEALDSLAAQTDPHFQVLVGDDASPHDLKPIVERHRANLNLCYKRFPDNLGRRDLVAHWNRCIRLTDSEWIWLFSDDDLADPACVAAWRETLRTNTDVCHVYRFQTKTIDREGRVIRWNPPHPHSETAMAFAYHRLARQRMSFACEYIFSRRAFEREGGMVSFPLAWGSDDASWIAFTGDKPIRTIEGPFVSWRSSGENLSTADRTTRDAKRDALLEFLAWLSVRIEMTNPRPNEPGPNDLRAMMPDWYLHQLIVADAPLNREDLDRVCQIARVAPVPKIRFIRQMLSNHRTRWSRRLKRILKERIRVE